MIVEIDSSIGLNANSLSNDQVSVLDGLALSRKRGDHFIISDKDTILSIIKHSGLSSPSKSIYKKILGEQTRWYNLLNDFSFRIRLVFSGSRIKEIDTVSGKAIEVPMDLFFEYNIDRPATVVAENYTDIDLYDYMSRFYLKSLNYINPRFNYSPVLGGGSTTSTVLENRSLKKMGITFCIVDSDKEYPDCDYGKTAQSALNANVNSPYTRIHVIEPREAENILPFNLLETVCKSSNANIKSIEQLKELSKQELNASNPVKYIDFKKGLKTYYAISPCDKTREYWSQVFQKAEIEVSCNAVGCESLKKCQCQKIHGLGTDLLKSVVKFLEEQSYDINGLDSHVKNDWINIWNSIIPYFIAPRLLPAA